MSDKKSILFVGGILLLVLCIAGCCASDGSNLSLLERIEQWYNNHMTYPAIALLMALESSFLGIIPSELIISAAAFVSAAPEAQVSFWGVVVFATVGSVGGGLINYTLAVLLGRKALYTLADSRLGHLMMLDGEKLQQAEKWFGRYSKLSVGLGRLVPGVRQFISIPAGLARMKLLPFVLYTALGSGVWNTVLAAMGYFLHGQRDLIEKYIFEISNLSILLVVLVIAFFIIKAKIKKKKRGA